MHHHHHRRPRLFFVCILFFSFCPPSLHGPKSFVPDWETLWQPPRRNNSRTESSQQPHFHPSIRPLSGQKIFAVRWLSSTEQKSQHSTLVGGWEGREFLIRRLICLQSGPIKNAFFLFLLSLSLCPVNDRFLCGKVGLNSAGLSQTHGGN